MVLLPHEPKVLLADVHEPERYDVGVGSAFVRIDDHLIIQQRIRHFDLVAKQVMYRYGRRTAVHDVQGDPRYLDPKKSFAHESYISACLMRLCGEGRFNMPDSASLREQEVMYEALLDELLYFLQQQAVLSISALQYRDSDHFRRK